MSEQTTLKELPQSDCVTIYEWQYYTVKEAVFELYRWGLRTDNIHVINFYRQMLGVFKMYDEKFVRPDVIASRRDDSAPQD